MRYVDSRGRTQDLNRLQAQYLVLADRGGFDRGWGGYASTLTMRLLRERGLITAVDGVMAGGVSWRITGLTHLGRDVLQRWNDREESR